MRFFNKLTAAVILASYIGIQAPFVHPVNAQEYKITPPPVVDPNSQVTLPDITNLPAVNTAVPNYPVNISNQGVTVVHAGTHMTIVLNSTVNSQNSQTGSMFTAILTDPVIANDKIIFPEGSEVTGQVTYLEKTGRFGKDAVMDVRFISIKPPNSPKTPILGKIMTYDKSGKLKGNNYKKQIVKDAATVTVASTGAGIAGLGLLSLVGEAGAGLVGGLATGGVLAVSYVCLRKGKNIELAGGSKLNVLLEQPITVIK